MRRRKGGCRRAIYTGKLVHVTFDSTWSLLDGTIGRAFVSFAHTRLWVEVVANHAKRSELHSNHQKGCEGRGIRYVVRHDGYFEDGDLERTAYRCAGSMSIPLQADAVLCATLTLLPSACPTLRVAEVAMEAPRRCL